jgi:hypothetical protein
VCDSKECLGKFREFGSGGKPSILSVFLRIQACELHSGILFTAGVMGSDSSEAKYLAEVRRCADFPS